MFHFTQVLKFIDWKHDGKCHGNYMQRLKLYVIDTKSGGKKPAVIVNLMTI